jgi:hypothetical protein
MVREFDMKVTGGMVCCLMSILTSFALEGKAENKEWGIIGVQAFQQTLGGQRPRIRTSVV